MTKTPKTKHIWMNDRRSLCDLRAALPARGLDDMDDEDFTAYVAEQTDAPACGSCVLLAGVIRNEAAVLMRSDAVWPDKPSQAWGQLTATRWAAHLDIESFVADPNLDRDIRYGRIELAVDPAIIDQMHAKDASRWDLLLNARKSAGAETDRG